MTESNPAARFSAVYRRAVRENFNFLKRTARVADAFAKAIPFTDPDGALLPVCDLHATDAALIEVLARWRAENASAYPTRFPVTREGTAAWLRDKLLAVEDRLLFLVLDRYGHPVGHLGFANALNDAGLMEVDNVIRGVKAGNPGIMRAAMRALLKWAHEVIGPTGFFLRVLEDNHHAIAFYRDLGFVDAERQPLRQQTRGEVVSLVPRPADDTAPPDNCFLRMTYAPGDPTVGQEMILTAGPSISAREAFYTWDAARNGWNHQWSHYLTRFQEAFAAYVGTKHALATSSCTGALHLALAALGIGPGDEVIVPDITWVATANAVLYVGATPIFADIEPDTWCLDPKSFEAKITPRTRAVMPVHLYGHPARMDQIVGIARKHRLFIVEDAAPAIGAEWQGRKTGTFGDIACFSFQGAKLVVSGEGGMLVTNDTALYERVYALWDQGRKPGTFWIQSNGLKYKMANVQAAVGLGQLERVDELVEMKRRIFGWYAEGLAGVTHVKLNFEVAGARSIYWMSSLELDTAAPLSRDQLRDALKKRNVDTRPVFPAISQYSIWPVKQEPQPVARRIGDQAINLPSGVCLRRSQVDYVCRAIREVLAGAA